MAGEKRTTVPFGAMHVMAVEPGTVITDERTGQKITVDDRTAAVKGSVIWCTEATFERLKQAARPN